MRNICFFFDVAAIRHIFVGVAAKVLQDEQINTGRGSSPPISGSVVLPIRRPGGPTNDETRFQTAAKTPWPCLRQPQKKRNPLCREKKKTSSSPHRAASRPVAHLDPATTRSFFRPSNPRRLILFRTPLRALLSLRPRLPSAIPPSVPKSLRQRHLPISLASALSCRSILTGGVGVAKILPFRMPLCCTEE